MNNIINEKHKLFILMSFCSYLLLSVPVTIQGANAPAMMAYYDITATQQGFIMTMQSVGTLGGCLFIALRGEQYNKIHTIVFGLLVLFLTCIYVGFSPSYPVLLVVIVGVGIGVSFIDIMMNSVVSDVYPKQKNTLLPLVHAFFGAGAMLTPIFVTHTVNPDLPKTFGRPYLIIGVVIAAVFVMYLLSGRRIMHETPYINMESMKKRAVENPAEIFKDRKSWYFMVVGVLYFNFQLGAAMWLSTYAIKEVGVSFSIGGMMLSAFFAGALPMRFLGPLFLRRFSPQFIFSVFGGVAAALMLAALSTNIVPAMFVLFAASGFMQGASVPMYILLCTEAFPGRSASAASLGSISGGIATLTAPLWMGGLSEYTGFRIPIILICCCLFVSTFMIFIKYRQKTDRQKASG